MTVQLVPSEGRAVWYGPLIDYRAEGVHVLSPGEIAEIDAALAQLHSFGPVDFPGITRENFPLPSLGEFIAVLGRELLHGQTVSAVAHRKMVEGLYSVYRPQA